MPQQGGRPAGRRARRPARRRRPGALAGSRSTDAGDADGRACEPPDAAPRTTGPCGDEVGAVPLGRDVVRVSGPTPSTYLQGQLQPGRRRPGGRGIGRRRWSCTPQGKLDALVRVTRVGRRRSGASTPTAGFGDALVARLHRFKLRVKVDIEPLPWRCVALRGPGAAARRRAARAAAGTVAGAGVCGTACRASTCSARRPRSPDGVRGVLGEAWESVRIEAGIPVMGAELDERTIAAEAGLVDRTVSFTKGCYTGQELVARLDARGNRVARHLRGLVVGLE